MFTFTDGVNSYTAAHDPRISEPLSGQGQTIPTLDGNAFLAFQYTGTGVTLDVQGARAVEFEWDDMAPLALAPYLVAAWKRHRSITCTWPKPEDSTATDTLTGYIPAQTPPEIEQTNHGCLRIKFILQAVS